MTYREVCVHRLLLATFALMATCGCSDSPYDLAPVRGKVTIDGQPLTAGKVMFAPIAQGDSREVGKPAFGVLQANGTFVLTTIREGDGAIVGDHWVTVFGPDKETVVTQISTPGAPKFSRLSVPQTKTVVGGQENDVDVSLTTQDVARYGVQ